MNEWINEFKMTVDFRHRQEKLHFILKHKQWVLNDCWNYLLKKLKLKLLKLNQGKQNPKLVQIKLKPTEQNLKGAKHWKKLN